MDCYIYYKTVQERLPQVLEQVIDIQKKLSQQVTVGMHLQRRPDATNGVHTWMEIYRQVPLDFDSILTKIVDQSKIHSMISGARHTEYFMDAMPCA